MKNKTICIIGAMDCEINKIKELLSDVETFNFGQFTFYKGRTYNKDAVVAKSGVGKVAAAVCTQILIDNFSPEFIINTGVAGGLKKGMQIGDIIIAERLVQHDFDASALGYAKGYICNGINPDKPTYFYPDKNLTDKFKTLLSENLINKNCFTGTIASGDMFISSNEKKKELVELFDATAAEMESGAIAQCSYLNNIPFVIIRAVSDMADDEASKKLVFTEEDTANLSAKTVNLFLSLL